jgi:tetratricopeptide (TPR) repeat protein
VKPLNLLRSSGALVVVAGMAGIFVAYPALATRSATNPPKPVIAVAAESVEGNYLAAVVAGAARDTDAAATYFREALRGDPLNAELMERGFVAFLANGSMPEAFKAAEQLIAREKNNGLAHLALGVRDLKLKQYVKARTHLVQGGRGRAADITATLLTAWSWAGTNDLAKATETIDRLKGENAFNVFRGYHAGLIALVAGKLDDAGTQLKGIYEQEKTTLRVVDAYARFLSRRGDTDAALAAYAGFDAVAPRHPIVRDAMEQLKQGKTLDPMVSSVQQGAAEVLYGLGSAGNQQGDELAAMIYLRLALHLDPQHAMAMVTLGDILERLKQHERAIEVYNLVPKTSPVRASSEIQIGLSLEVLNRGEEAVKQLEQLIVEHPTDIDALVALGNVYRSRKKYPESADTYTKALAVLGEPTPRANWTLLYFRGIAFERSKQWPKAEADFKRALELAPDSQARERAVVLNYLGYSWVDQGANLDEGFQMLKQAVDLRPRDGYIVDSLGWAYYRLARYDDAVRELEKAIDLKPSDPTINDHLGDAYWKVGRRLEAKFQWNHARDLSPEPEDLEKILKKIEFGMVEEAPAAVGGAEKEQKDGG